MTEVAFINRCPNDILRLILKDASPGPRELKNHQLVCRKWYNLFSDNRFWRELYIRDFNPEGALSDLANYKLIYQKEYTKSDQDDRGFIPITQLLPENMIFGPIQKLYDGSFNIVQQYVDYNMGVAKRPMWVKISGFQLQIDANTGRNYYYRNSNSIKVLGLDNTEFKMAMNNMRQHIVKNNDLIVSHKKGNVFTHNGRQYAQAGDVLFGDQLPSIEKGEHIPLTIDEKTILWNPRTWNFNAWETGIRERCEKCKEWHNHGTSNGGYYNRTIGTNNMCIHYTTRYDDKNKKATSNSSPIVFNNCTFVCTLNGFKVTKDNKLETNWNIKEVWFAEPKTK